MKLEEILNGRDLVIFDLETTGTSVKTDRIIQYGHLIIHADGRKREPYSTLINPEIPIPPEASAINGITNEMVEHAPRFCDFSPTLTKDIEGCDLGGYNVLAFDLPLLREEYRRCGKELDMIGRKVVDGLFIFRHYFRRDLASALRYYCDKEIEDAHTAIGDVRATIDVIEAQLDRHTDRDIPQDVPGLHRVCFGDRITPDGRIRWQDEMPCLSFGTHAGTPLQEMVKNSKKRDYLQWILKSDFSEDVKTVITDALAGTFPVRDLD